MNYEATTWSGQLKPNPTNTNKLLNLVQFFNSKIRRREKENREREKNEKGINVKKKTERENGFFFFILPRQFLVNSV